MVKDLFVILKQVCIEYKTFNKVLEIMQIDNNRAKYKKCKKCENGFIFIINKEGDFVQVNCPVCKGKGFTNAR